MSPPTQERPALKLYRSPTWQQAFARRWEDVAGWTLASGDRITLMDTVRNAKLTVLVGVTAQPGLFSAEVLSTMAAHEPRPVIMALSNPQQVRMHARGCGARDRRPRSGRDR